MKVVSFILPPPMMTGKSKIQKLVLDYTTISLENSYLVNFVNLFFYKNLLKSIHTYNCPNYCSESFCDTYSLPYKMLIRLVFAPTPDAP